MHIVSKFKDFYDYLQYSFGQDDNIYWDRDVILKDKDENFIIKSTDLIELNIKYNYNNMFRHRLFMDDFEFNNFGVFEVLIFNYYKLIYFGYPIPLLVRRSDCIINLID